MLTFARPCTQIMILIGLFCEYRHSLESLSRNAHIKFYISLAFHVPLWYVTVWCVFKNNKMVRVLRICICLNFHLKSDYAITMRLHHSRDGSTYLRCNLMCFVYFVFFKQNALSFNLDMPSSSIFTDDTSPFKIDNQYLLLCHILNWQGSFH
jgi:hypothetical protein